MWTAFTIPFVLVAIVVATGPVYYMTYHSKGTITSPPKRRQRIRRRSVETTCPECRAIVSDPVEQGSPSR